MRRSLTWTGGAASAVIVLASLLAGTAGAQSGTPTDGQQTPQSAGPVDTSAAMVSLEAEVAGLVRLGIARGGPLPFEVEQAVVEWTKELKLDRKGQIDFVRFFDEDAAAEFAKLPVERLSQDARTVLAPLPDGFLDALGPNRPTPKGPPLDMYARALAELKELALLDPVPGTNSDAAPVTDVPATTGPGVTTPAPVNQAEPSSTGADAVDRTDDGGSSPLVWIAAGVVGLLAVVGAGSLMRRATRRRTAAVATATTLTDSVAGLLDASRRFGSSVDSAEILAILVAETMALSDSEAAAVVEVAPDGSTVRLTPSPGGVPLLHLEQSDRSIVRRALETGLPSRMVGVDPAVAGGERAIIAIPFVREGVVAGAVVAVRSVERPYESGDVDVLTQLVPMAAAALVGAGRHDDVAELSLTDGLTELGNRRRLDRDLLSALATPSASGTVGFVMVDIDHFKQFNDTHGHVAGDEVLQSVARLLRANVRGEDVVYRYGGEEFCVLLPNADPDEALEVAERLRAAVESHDFEGAETQPGGRLTISVGMTMANRSNPQVVKERADHALYEAKHQGRNRVVVDLTDPTAGPTIEPTA